MEAFAAIYRWENERFQNLPSYKETSAQLTKIDKQAARLLSSLEDIGWEAQIAIEKSMDMDGAKGITQNRSAPDHPSLFLSLKDFTDDLVGVTVDLPALKAILGGLQFAASNGQRNLNKRPSAKIPDCGLRLWLANIEERWQRWSDHPFSRDVGSTGEPVTYAGQFCVAAFQKIEPDYSVSRIMNGLKNLRTERRKRTGKAGEQTTP